MSRLWGGRFLGETDREVVAFGRSISTDARLADADLRGSIAHARMLGQIGVLSPAEVSQIQFGLEKIRQDLREGVGQDPRTSADHEDIHSWIESTLTSQIGLVAGKLHTARSRNDQVVTSTRLYLREQTDALQGDLKIIQEILIGLSEKHLETLLPGMTHLQHAQPVSLAHHLLAYFWMFDRDRGRLRDARARINLLPLGSAALGGTSFPIDRMSIAQELGFDGLCENSLDAVSDRDFVVEFLSAASLISMHLSRFAEELILWSTPEFSWIEMSDSVTTGSSIMPQKKNPDMAELIRGRTGRVFGALHGALVMLKGLPLSYNRDMQEDKIHLFEGLDTVRACIQILRRVLENTEFRPEKMRASLRGDFSNATDLADFLVTKGMPFRRAHEVVGAIVRSCLERRISLEELKLVDYQEFSPLFDAQILKVVQHVSVVRARTSRGGTAPTSVQEQLRLARHQLSKV